MKATIAPPLTALAAAQIATLNGIVKTLAMRPDIAPLLNYMFQNLSQPLSSQSTPFTALDALAEAFGKNGAQVTRFDTDREFGLDIRFRGGCGAVWVHAPSGEVAAEAVVESDADVPAETEDADDDETQVPVESMVESPVAA